MENALKKHARLDADFNCEGAPNAARLSRSRDKLKTENIEAAFGHLFGEDLRIPRPYKFNSQLSHKIHRIISQGNLIPGGGEIWIQELHGPQVSDGNRHFSLLSHDEAEKKLDELFSLCSSFINERESLRLSDKFRTAAYFLHRFLAIHPYCDGNGRVARLLTSLLLMRLGAAVHPVCFNLQPENRKRYIAGLNVEGDVTGPESEPLRALAQLLEEAAEDTRVSHRLHNSDYQHAAQA